MTFSRNLFTCLALAITTTGAFAAAPATNAPPAAAAPASKQVATNAPAATPPAAAPAAAPAKPASILDGYIKDLAAEVNLTDAEKKEIESYYEDDGVELKKILNDDTVSPLQQAREVSRLRAARNVKIDALLDDLDRQHEFHKVEAKYRVALTELAATGGLVPPPSPPPPATLASPPKQS